MDRGYRSGRLVVELLTRGAGVPCSIPGPAKFSLNVNATSYFPTTFTLNSVLRWIS